MISDPKNGRHRNQVLSDVVIYADRWEGRVTAALGDSVNVSKEAVSSLFGRSVDDITLKYGAHSGRRSSPSGTPSARNWTLHPPGRLEARPGTGPAQDPPGRGRRGPEHRRPGGARRRRRRPGRPPRVVNIGELAGALRRSIDLVSYEPGRRNPRRAIIRVMDHNPWRPATTSRALTP
ncbi:hypothetical protein NKH18_00410 [Streptomyces sp. M10(2022)]